MNRLIFLIITCFWSCSVSFSLSGVAIPEGMKTYSIDFFNNRTALAPNLLAQNFTDALKQYFLSQSPLVQTENQADLEISGEISEYKIEPIAISGNNNQAAQNRLTLSVKVKVVNLINEKDGFEQSFSKYQDFNADRQLIDLEEELNREMTKQLTEEIYNKIFSNW